MSSWLSSRVVRRGMILAGLVGADVLLMVLYAPAGGS